MRINEILTEAKSADLYHGSAISNAERILASNKLIANLPAGQLGIDSFKYRTRDPSSNRYKQTATDLTCSFSRNISVAVEFACPKRSKGLGRHPGVIFVIDQGILQRDMGKRMKPFDYFAGFDELNQHSRSEAEETVFGDITNFSKYIKEIIILNAPATPENIKKYPHIFNFKNSQLATV